MAGCGYWRCKAKSKHNSLWSDQPKQDKPMSKYFGEHHCWSTRVVYRGCRDLDTICGTSMSCNIFIINCGPKKYSSVKISKLAMSEYCSIMLCCHIYHVDIGYCNVLLAHLHAWHILELYVIIFQVEIHKYVLIKDSNYVYVLKYLCLQILFFTGPWEMFINLSSRHIWVVYFPHWWSKEGATNLMLTPW